jgi:hypothetical protein
MKKLQETVKMRKGPKVEQPPVTAHPLGPAKSRAGSGYLQLIGKVSEEDSPVITSIAVTLSK